MNFGCWNVRTLQDNENSLERKSALVVKIFKSFEIDVAAISETRLADTGQIDEIGTGYSVFWSGRPSTEPRQHGVGFAIRSSLVSKLPSLPQSISSRLMTLRFPVDKNTFTTVISAYAPTMTCSENDIDSFYSDLRQVLLKIPFHDKIVLLGDFNARVGSDSDAWPNVLGHHGTGKMNSNGLRLLALCSEFGLTITNTIFQQADKFKNTWQHPRSKHWHMLDYVIVRKRDIRDVKLTKVHRTAECYSDHRLVRSKLSFQPYLKKPLHKSSKIKKIDVHQLKDPCVQNRLQTSLNSKLSDCDIDENIDESWKKLREAIYSSSSEILGFCKRKHQDWFDENDAEINTLLDNMHQRHKAWISNKLSSLKQSYLEAKREAQRKLREMKNAWFVDKARELQTAADSHNIKALHDGLKAIYGPSSSGTAPVLSKDGNELLTDKKNILDRWAEHFNTLLNRPSVTDDSVIDAITQRPIKHELGIDPSLKEVRVAVKQMSSGKAPGPDGIPVEIYKFGGEHLIKKLHKLFCTIWNQGTVPQEYKDASITHLYKKKGNKAICDNHRGISLLCIAGKILARVILNRINDKLVNDIYPESQCGFRSGRGTVDMMFSLRQVQEKAREQNSELFMVFVDLTKAFDTVCRPALWKILKKLGIPDSMAKVIISFHDGMMASVCSGGEDSDPFSVTNGTKQGCVLAPVLFALFFSLMLEHAFADFDKGVSFQFRTSGGLFNLTGQSFRAKTKTRLELLRDLLFADDCALIAHSVEELQAIVDRFSRAATAFGLTISIPKTVVLHQPKPKTLAEDVTIPEIRVNGESLKSVNSFCYLGGTVNSHATLDNEINTRIARASQTFGTLHHRLWKDHDIKLDTKISVYRSSILSSLLYGAESWAPYFRHIKQLDVFHMRCLRSICNIRWDDKVSNEKVLERCKISGIEAMLMRIQCRWAGHVVRMEDNRIPKILLYGQQEVGKRERGRPLLRYKDRLKHTFKALKIDLGSWETVCLNRPRWRKIVYDSARTFEHDRLQHRSDLRKAVKVRRLLPSTSSQTCDICDFTARSKAGLVLHKRKKH